MSNILTVVFMLGMTWSLELLETPSSRSVLCITDLHFVYRLFLLDIQAQVQSRHWWSTVEDRSSSRYVHCQCLS
ncbi:hypothetical protein BDZ97DRAFT_1803295 [Flammula alnicola]|nr:hypothetical protein BDZ97DRAFT_1803295 [Flammula alnicola]